jgi:hypothetical protein
MIFGKWDERGASRHDSKSSSSPVPVVVPSASSSGGSSSDALKKTPLPIDRAAD